MTKSTYHKHTTMKITRFFTIFIVAYSCCMLASCLATPAGTNISIDQSALLALKARITSDPHSLISTNWSKSTPLCNWVGVTCGKKHHRVTSLNISYFDLEGTIPPELGNLSFLVTMDFQNNSFHGLLPLELARLRRIKTISFSFNKLMGVIPSWFGSLSNLQFLSLNSNKFSGSIPIATFNSSTLEFINLSYNQLSGKIPREIGNLTSLKEIFLGSNHFIEVPNEIGLLDHLEMLFLQENALKGDVPRALFNMSSLITLMLSGNKLKGRLPHNICQNLPRIQNLSLSNNQIEGPLPSSFQQCKELTDLRLNDNNFSGSIPKNIGNATKLAEIYLKDNKLSGTIPYEMGGLPNLQRLSIGVNYLSGLIPKSIFNNSKAIGISLTLNQLYGTLPIDLGIGLPNIERLLLGGNQMSGTIPKSISNASNLLRLDMGKNNLSGFIPSSICALSNLQSLKLITNNLTFDTTTSEANFLFCLKNLVNLKLLAFSHNPLNASLPDLIRNLPTSLESLYLYNCSLRGNIPSDIGNLSSLTVLSLYNNELSGSIPSSLGKLRNLQGLDLKGSGLQGEIPHELCQLSYLEFLGLSHNILSGSIPSCLGHLATALRILDLSSNLLNSTIPSALYGLTNILYVDLSSNSLTGSLSESISNLKVVTWMNLSNNHFSSRIPSSIGTLQSLVNLSLANNEFEGLIPSSFGNSLSLEYLDLSRNNLSGIIPKSLESLKFLKGLNLSFNKLNGEIPNGGSFRHFSAQSFLSNEELCGAPRFHVKLCKAHSTKARKSIWKYIVPVILSAMFIVSIWAGVLCRRKNVDATQVTTFSPQVLWRRVSHLDLVRATNAFDESNLLGSGSFGKVYKGTLSDGAEVAVKVFNLTLEGAFKSFDIECEMLGNIHHRNLIKIISCCSQVDFKAVVLNYMGNGSLEKWLHSQNLCLNIQQRLSIMIDVASALEYLHHGYEPPIVHCDLKPSNILLDEDMSAQVADFGIAKLLCGTSSITHTITQATIGYMAPEYGMEGIVTKRGDVYSFGILLMETFTGKKPTDEMFVEETSLKQWVADAALHDIVDANLQVMDGDVVTKECLEAIIMLALACSAELPRERTNMQEALAMLKKIHVKFLKKASRGGVLN